MPAIVGPQWEKDNWQAGGSQKAERRKPEESSDGKTSRPGYLEDAQNKQTHFGFASNLGEAVNRFI